MCNNNDSIISSSRYCGRLAIRVSGNLIVSLLSTSNVFLFYLMFVRHILMHVKSFFWSIFEIP